MIAWLRREPHRILLCALYITLVWMFMYAWSWITTYVFGRASSSEGGNIFADPAKAYIGILAYVIIGPLIEEIQHRIPLTFFARWTQDHRTLILFSILSSIWFGEGHRNGDFQEILYTGGIGFVLCIFYLKLGGIHGRLWKPWLLTMIVHSGWNLYVMVGRHWE